MDVQTVPNVVVRRLVIYLRCLLEALDEDAGFISSLELSGRAGVTAAQVRKDLATFGQFGKQGVGYEIDALQRRVASLLNVDRPIPLAVLGVGELGTALARYLVRQPHTDFPHPFTVAALLDVDPAKIGQEVEGIVIEHFDRMEAVVKEREICMALITVPASSAQAVAEAAFTTGIRALLNFAPVRLDLPPSAKVHNADVLLDLHQLAYYL